MIVKLRAVKKTGSQLSDLATSANNGIAVTVGARCRIVERAKPVGWSFHVLELSHCRVHKGLAQETVSLIVKTCRGECYVRSGYRRCRIHWSLTLATCFAKQDNQH